MVELVYKGHIIQRLLKVVLILLYEGHIIQRLVAKVVLIQRVELLSVIQRLLGCPYSEVLFRGSIQWNFSIKESKDTLGPWKFSDCQVILIRPLST